MISASYIIIISNNSDENERLGSSVNKATIGVPR